MIARRAMCSRRTWARSPPPTGATPFTDLKLPVGRLISKPLAEERSRLIADDRAACDVQPADLGAFTSADWRDTIYRSETAGRALDLEAAGRRALQAHRR